MATSRPQSPRSHRRRVPTRDPAATAGEKKNRRGRRAAHLLRFKRSSRAGDASPCRPHTGLARSTSGSPLDPAPFRQDEPRGGATAPQGKTPTLLSRQGLEPVASAAKALSPTEPGGETQVEATCVNARRKVGTDPGSIPGASNTPKACVFKTLANRRQLEPRFENQIQRHDLRGRVVVDPEVSHKLRTRLAAVSPKTGTAAPQQRGSRTGRTRPGRG